MLGEVLTKVRNTIMTSNLKPANPLAENKGADKHDESLWASLRNCWKTFNFIFNVGMNDRLHLHENELSDKWIPPKWCNQENYEIKGTPL